MNDTALRRMAAESIAKGRLPNASPQQTSGGPGTGAECALCGAVIDKDELEFEVEFGRKVGRYHLHLACFSAWDAERKALMARGRPPADAAGAAAVSAALSESPAGNRKAALPAQGADGKITVHGGISAKAGTS